MEGLSIASFTIVLTAVSAFLIRFNHKRIRSKCCGKDCISSVDVEDTTPQPTPQTTPK